METVPKTNSCEGELAIKKIRSDDVLCKSSKSRAINSDVEKIEDDSKTKLWRNMLKNLKDNLGSIIMLVLLSMITTSWDVYSDWAVTIQLFLLGDPLYAISLMIPQLCNIIFTFFIWKKLEKKKTKRWSWLLVITQCWPQFFAARIVWMILKGEKRKKNSRILSLEILQ